MTVVAHWLDANLKSIPLRRKQLHLYFVLNSSGPFPRSLTKSKYIFSASADKKLSDRKLIFYLWSTEDFGGGLRGAFVTHVTVCLHGKILKRIEKVCPGRPGALVVICLVFFWASACLAVCKTHRVMYVWTIIHCTKSFSLAGFSNLSKVLFFVPLRNFVYFFLFIIWLTCSNFFNRKADDNLNFLCNGLYMLYNAIKVLSESRHCLELKLSKTESEI